MRPGRAGRFLAEINKKVGVKLKTAFIRITVDLDQIGTLFGDIRIELVIPAAEQ